MQPLPLAHSPALQVLLWMRSWRSRCTPTRERPCCCFIRLIKSEWHSNQWVPPEKCFCHEHTQSTLWVQPIIILRRLHICAIFVAIIHSCFLLYSRTQKALMCATDIFLPPMPASLKDPLQTMYLNGFGGHAPPVVSFSHACTPFAQRFAHTSAYPAPLSIQDGCVRYMHFLRKCIFSAFIPAYNTPLSICKTKISKTIERLPCTLCEVLRAPRFSTAWPPPWLLVVENTCYIHRHPRQHAPTIRVITVRARGKI